MVLRRHQQRGVRLPRRLARLPASAIWGNSKSARATRPFLSMTSHGQFRSSSSARRTKVIPGAHSTYRLNSAHPDRSRKRRRCRLAFYCSEVGGQRQTGVRAEAEPTSHTCPDESTIHAESDRVDSCAISFRIEPVLATAPSSNIRRSCAKSRTTARSWPRLQPRTSTTSTSPHASRLTRSAHREP